MSLDVEFRHPWQGLIAPIVCLAVVGAGVGLSIPLLSLEMEVRGHSGVMIGANTAMPALAGILVAPFTAKLVHTIGTTRLLLSCLAVAAAMLLSFYLIDNVWVWFPLRLAYGAAVSIVFIVSEYWINAQVVDGKRGLTIGVYNSVLAMGFAAGPLILSLTGIGTIAPYAAGIAIYAVAAAPVVIGARYAPVLDSAPSFALTKIVRQAPSSTLAAFVFGAIEAGAFSLLVIYALRIGVLPPAPTILIAVVALGNVIFQVPIGYLGDILDRRLLLVFCAVIGAAGALALPFVAFNPWILYPVAAAWGGIIVGLYTLGLTHLGSQYKGPELAAASSAFVMLYSLGSLVGPLTLGIGIDVWDPHGYIVVLVLVFCLFAILVAARWLRAPAIVLNAHNKHAG